LTSLPVSILIHEVGHALIGSILGFKNVKIGFMSYILEDYQGNRDEKTWSFYAGLPAH